LPQYTTFMPFCSSPLSFPGSLLRPVLGGVLIGTLAGPFAGCAGLAGPRPAPLPSGDASQPAAQPQGAVKAVQQTADPNLGPSEHRPQDEAAGMPGTGSRDAQWSTAGEALGLTGADPAGPDGAEAADTIHAPPFTLEGIDAQVAATCGAAGGGRRGVYLPGLTAELYAARIPPGEATEALIRADCGSLADIVRTMVAAGGDGAVSPVVNRALFLAGPRAAGIVEAAASAGLKRDLGSPGRTNAGQPEPRLASYAMAYFPSGPPNGSTGAPGQTAAEVSPLYNQATPGYGIYTYVLLGNGFPDLPEADSLRYREFLRLIQTYVLAADPPDLGPDARAHSFLLAVYPRRKGQPLIDQTGPELSAAMREALVQYVGSLGEAGLAERVRTGPGPFLVSGPEPRLIPSSKASPRLVADLSDLAPEYLYPVVDAYDRPIADGDLGRAAGLEPIRERLANVFQVAAESVGSDPAPDAASAGRWVYLLGRDATPEAVTPGADPAGDPSAVPPAQAAKGPRGAAGAPAHSGLTRRALTQSLGHGG
jgi:hypothetical protein